MKRWLGVIENDNKTDGISKENREDRVVGKRDMGRPILIIWAQQYEKKSSLPDSCKIT